jgi:hypothetical protein
MTTNRHSIQLHFITLQHAAGYTTPSTENSKTFNGRGTQFDMNTELQTTDALSTGLPTELFEYLRLSSAEQVALVW